jgi:hypothetical protein
MKTSKILKGSLMSSLLLAATAAHAQVPANQVQLGTPSYMGTGCPLGTVSAQLSPDAQALSIMFGSFQAIAGGSSGLTVDRKQCNIAIPVHVPQGFTVSIMKIDYRGYKRLPIYASGTFDVEYFFAGQTGPAYHKSFVGAEDGNFTLSNQLVATSTVWSACGADVNLRTNTSIAVQTNSMQEQAQLTLDSADVTSGVVYQLSWKQCGGNNGGYPNPYPTPYPTPNPYPTPDPYGNGNNGNGNNGNGNYPGVGPCVINSYYDTRGYQMFMIKDGMGRVVGNTVQYAEALRLAQQSQAMGFCSGIVNNSQPANPQQGNGNNNGNGYPNGNGNGSGWPGNNSPYPNGNGGYPQPQPQQNGCQIMPGRDAYGRNFYRVVDRQGRIVLNTAVLATAQQTARTDVRCR